MRFYSSQLQRQFWALDWLGNHLIRLPIVNHEDCHIKFQIQIGDANMIESKLQIILHFKGSQACLL